MPQIVETDTMLGRLKLGDPSAFSLLYEYYWEEMYKNAYKRVKDAHFDHREKLPE